MEKAAAAAGKGMAAVEEKEGRKRKIPLEESEVSSSSVQFKTRRFAAENAASSVSSGNSTTCQSVNSGDVLASCCSSSRLSELAKDNWKSADLERETEVTVKCFTASGERSVDFTHSHRREKRPPPSNETEPQSSEPELTPIMPPRDSNPRRRSTGKKKMPSEPELEEFFAAAEKNLQKQFIDKYNYDIVKDEPMKGRYEWVPIQLNPSCSLKKKKKKALTI